MEELLKYLKIIYRRRYLFLAVSLVAMTVFIAASYHTPKLYKAQSTVFIEKNVIANLIKDIAVTPEMDERIRVISYALLSRGLITRALENVPSFTKPENDAELNTFVEALAKRTNVQVNRNELFIVSITDQNPRFAYEYINALVKLYVEENLSGKRDETYGASRFLDEQLVYFKRKLDQAEDAIIEFRKKHGLFTGGDKESLQELKSYQREVKDIELALETQEARKKQSLLQLKTIPRSLPIYGAEDDKNRAVVLEARLRKLLTTYNEDYPEVIRLRAEMESLNEGGSPGSIESGSNAGATMPNTVYQEVQQNVFDLESEISSLRTRKKHLEKRMVLIEKDLQGNPVHKKELDRLAQEANSSRKIYEQLLASAGKSEVSKQMELSDKSTTFRIVDAAIMPRKPVSPNMIRMIMLSILAGFLVGGGVVIIVENIKKTIIGTDEIKTLGFKILGTISTIVEPISMAHQRKKDVIVYSVSLTYFALVLSVLAYEVMLGFK